MPVASSGCCRDDNIGLAATLAAYSQPAANCSVLAETGLCTSNATTSQLLRTSFCNATCDLCSGCVDDEAGLASALLANNQTLVNCSQIAHGGLCSAYAAVAQPYCNASCCLCNGTPEEPVCQDNNNGLFAVSGSNCATLASLGGCSDSASPTVQAAAQAFCSATCGFCGSAAFVPTCPRGMATTDNPDAMQSPGCGTPCHRGAKQALPHEAIIAVCMLEILIAVICLLTFLMDWRFEIYPERFKYPGIIIVFMAGLVLALGFGGTLQLM